ncbi:MAG: tRNA glutamyl-Q(34) synthetase GluQRS [Kiritimatiellia bacterium]|jgi:glutamyl-tRNA synthetase
MSGYVGRLAPSPTGALHLGNARSFLVAWLRARASGGRLILRIEDLDHPKVKPGSAAQILDDLRWMGLDWDEGPDIGGGHGPYVQTRRLDLYASALERLRAAGLVYPCICARRDVEAGQSAPHASEDGLFYPGTCRGRFASYAEARSALPPDRLPAWRFRAPDNAAGRFIDLLCGPQRQCVARETGDFVLARHPAGAGYMLAVVVDDAAMGVTEVVRGGDLLPATHRQLLLHAALGLPSPAYLHVPLVVGPDGRRLAKRHGDTRLSAFRQAGVPAARIVGFLARSLGWAAPGEELLPADLVPRFTLETIPESPLVVSPDDVARLMG